MLSEVGLLWVALFYATATGANGPFSVSNRQSIQGSHQLISNRSVSVAVLTFISARAVLAQNPQFYDGRAGAIDEFAL